ncbi:MAG: hypothetical protein IT249_17920 [Chitinophagaceae bacterium]|nr:hypothetical protein [Chitinophagaceae bacterium]
MNNHIMQGKRHFKYLLFCLCFFFEGALAQGDFADIIRQQFNQYNQQTFTEKIYLHTDRNFYVAGEIIWFKIYITDGVKNNLSNLSKIAYTELLDKNNNVLLQTKNNITGGTGNGSFYLPANIPSGNYTIRCYTNWMKNFDASFFFEGAVSIVNTTSSGMQTMPDTIPFYDINFFPEGGNLVQETENNIGFKIVDKNGIGINKCTGIITDGNDSIVLFVPQHAGIGTFLFTPLKEHVYTAHIIDALGKEILRKPIPAASEGLAMRLAVTSTGKITITIKSAPGNQENGKALYLFAHTRGVIKSIQKTLLQPGTTQFIVEESKLNDGITHFTIFNSERRPVCERLYFKRPLQKLNIGTTADAKQYSTRKKAVLQIHSTDADNKSVAANMSLSLYRIDDLQKKKTTDIYSYLWLNADLAGNIEDPLYYFDNINDATTKQLDNLVLTHGWRRFKWDNIQQNKKPLFEFLPEFEGQIITGKIIDSSTKKPFPDAIVFASVPGPYTQYYSSQSDNNGNIKFYTKNIVGPGELVLQAQETDKHFYSIEINTPFSGKFTENRLTDLNISPDLKSALETVSINAQLQRKYAADMLRKYYLPDVDTSTFYGKPDERYMLDDYTRFTTMEEVLREYIPGVIVGRANRKFKLTVFDVQNKRLFKDAPLVLLDGVPVQDADKIISYDPLKVRKIEVVTRRYYYGPLVLDGIVNFITYKGNLEEYEMDPRSVILDFEGVQLQREFYMPFYDTEAQRKSRLADFRNLLYWNPNVVTNKNGETQLQFYTSDMKGKYIGVIEGITPDGKAGRSTFSLEVTQ